MVPLLPLRSAERATMIALDLLVGAAARGLSALEGTVTAFLARCNELPPPAHRACTHTGQEPADF